jgi:hypothetical protein
MVHLQASAIAYDRHIGLLQNIDFANEVPADGIQRYLSSQEFGIFQWQLSQMVHPPFAYGEGCLICISFRCRTAMSPPRHEAVDPALALASRDRVISGQHICTRP